MNTFHSRRTPVSSHHQQYNFRFRLTAWLAGISMLAAAGFAWAAPEAFEVGPDTKDQLPRGKEADGIIGDFLLRNDKVEAVISCNALYRRANMSTFYGETGITPGCLYDLTLKGENNDQITIFAPSGQQGIVSYVRVLKNGSDGEASIETVVTAANNNGLYKRHEYRLRDGWQGVWIVTTVRNESKEPRKGTVEDRWTNFSSTGKAGDVTWSDAVDPSDKAGYAYAWLEKDGLKAPPKELDLKPGQEVTFARFIAVGHSPAEAVGVVSSVRGPTGFVTGTVKNSAGAAVVSAKVEVPISGKPVPAYPDAQGRFRIALPAGTYELEAGDIGRESVKQSVTVTDGKETAVGAVLPAQAAVSFDIRGDDGKGIPCKVQFNGVDGTKSPVLGPANRAHGCVDQFHSEKGTFRVALPPGTYEVVVTHGIEFSHLKKKIQLVVGQSQNIQATLKRLVDTRGWISADFHNHSTPSGDNTCGTDDRIINLAAEHIEFAPTTEHNRLYDWRPNIDRLGLASEIQTVSGLELTGGAAHFNSFPFTPEPFTQNNGAPLWNKDPRITAITLQDHQKPEPDRWVQINHPEMVVNFIDRDEDGRADGGYIGLSQLIDGVETQNYSDSKILGGAPFEIGKDKAGRPSVNYIREFIWLQLL
ncbi:MAG TPA: carboxypeptidase regulatory-like domain-containing protein, partial [Roseimicrobium sp.]|nr:carboxypeptidase regulatory-like domain-containing protein [Roseimicrobium sp.]